MEEVGKAHQVIHTRVAQIPIPRRFSGSGFPNFCELGIGIEISSGRDRDFPVMYFTQIFMNFHDFFEFFICNNYRI